MFLTLRSRGLELLVGERDNLAMGDSLATPRSFSDSSRSLSDVIRGLCLDEVL